MSDRTEERCRWCDGELDDMTYIGASLELRAKDLTDRQRDLLCQFIGGRV